MLLEQFVADWDVLCSPGSESTVKTPNVICVIKSLTSSTVTIPLLRNKS
jgi:hypothetical protein